MVWKSVVCALAPMAAMLGCDARPVTTWDPGSDSLPTSLVVMQSREGFDVHLDGALHIPIDDTTFIGNCAAGNVLSEAQAAFITELVFPDVFASRRYDAATCTVTPAADDGGAGGE